MRSTLLAFVLGVSLLQQQENLPTLALTVVLIPLGAVCWQIRHRRILARSCAVILAMAAGFFWAAAFAEYRLSDELPAIWEGADIEVVGVVAEMPKPQERGERFLFDVEQVLTPQARVPSTLSLAFYATGYREASLLAPVSQFHAGERWRLTVRLKRPHGNYNPYGFDFEVWALERNIRATGYLRKNITTQRMRGMVWRPGYVIERLRENLRDRLRDVLAGQPYEGVLRALAIGDESGISRAEWQIFTRTGINHLMSISGLHVTMVSGLLFALAYGIWRRMPKLVLRLPASKAAALVGAFAAFFYALLAGFAVPSQRTVYMLTVIALALWTGRNIAISLVLCWALFVVTLLDPWAVLSAGFWLSFGAVAVMVFAGSNRLARAHWLWQALHSQWAVTIGLIPLLLVLFQQVSFVSPVANAFAIPIVSLVVVPLTLAGCVLPVDLILQCAHSVMALCMGPLEWMSGLSVAVWQQHAPPVWTLLPGMLGLMWLLLPRGIPGRWLGVLPMLPMFLLVPKAPAHGELRATVLDVGQGLAVVTQTAHHALLFDAGARFSADADSGSSVVVPFLRGSSIARLDGFIVSHDDLDHSGGALSVLDAVPATWFGSSLPFGHALLTEAPQPRRCFSGQKWEWDGVRFEVLHPAWESYAAADLKDNDRSCVIKITSPNGSLLIPADIERDAEMKLVEYDAAKLSSDILVAPHHGSKTSSTEGFLEAVRPSASIFTVGYRNRFGHPKPEIIDRYRSTGSRIYRSDEDGALLIEYVEDGIGIRTWRGARPRYWLAESQDAR